MSKARAPKRSATAVDLGRRHEQEDRLRIDEAADQPGAGDPVDLGPRAGHPDGPALRIARRQLGLGHHRQPGGSPGLHAALQGLGLDAGMAEPGGGAVAELAAVRQMTTALRPTRSGPSRRCR